MPELTPYQLTFTGGLHLGTRGVNLEESRIRLPSDTLFSALVDALSRAGVDIDAYLTPFLEPSQDPPFLLTSTFPFVGGVRFYPLPVDLTRLFSQEAFQRRGKSLKGIRYFSEALLRRALAGELLDEWLFPEDETQEPGAGLSLQGGALWLTSEEIGALPADFQPPRGKLRPMQYLNVWSQGRTPRVTVDRVTSASNIFHAGRAVFAQGCGLWFGMEWRSPSTNIGPGDETYRQAVERGLALLQDDGLGGERSAGYGAFHFALGETFSLPDPVSNQPAFLLSRYLPREAELPDALSDPRAAYALEAVEGWLRSLDGAAQRRQRLTLVSEGSLICPPAVPAGRLIDVRPRFHNPDGDLPHPVYRAGLALAIGWPA